MQMARLVDDVADSGSGDGVSFDFGVSRITSSDLDEFARAAWFDRDSARLSEGETVSDPHDDKVIVFKEFFYAGLRFPPHLLVCWSFKEVQPQVSSIEPF
jgi:hypothetical protein